MYELYRRCVVCLNVAQQHFQQFSVTTIDISELFCEVKPSKQIMNVLCNIFYGMYAFVKIKKSCYFFVFALIKMFPWINTKFRQNTVTYSKFLLHLLYIEHLFDPCKNFEVASPFDTHFRMQNLFFLTTFVFELCW